MPCGGPWCSCASSWPWSWEWVAALMWCSASGLREFGLPGRRGHVVDGRLHGGVGQRHVPALRRHGALALDGVVLQDGHALLEARAPGGLVAELRRAGRARAVTGRAGGVVGALAVASLGGRGGRNLLACALRRSGSGRALGGGGGSRLPGHLRLHLRYPRGAFRGAPS